jgi:hypothetical protein
MERLTLIGIFGEGTTLTLARKGVWRQKRNPGHHRFIGDSAFYFGKLEPKSYLVFTLVNLTTKK